MHRVYKHCIADVCQATGWQEWRCSTAFQVLYTLLFYGHDAGKCKQPNVNMT